MPPWLSAERLELEERWRARLKEAHEKYRAAKIANTQFQENWKPSKDADPDGCFERQRVMRAETAALREYARVLQIFTELTVSGKAPKE